MNCLHEKWRLWFKLLDVNHDGKLTMDDVKISRRQFTDLHDLEKDMGSQTQENITAWWTTYIFRGNQGVEITVDDFVDGNEKAYRENKAKFTDEATACFKQLFGIFDANHDGKLSEKDILIAYKAWGCENEVGQRYSFQLLKPENGVVPISKIVDAWLQFATCEDGSEPDVIREALTKGV